MKRILKSFVFFMTVLPNLACGAHSSNHHRGVSIHLETLDGRILNTFAHGGKVFTLGEYGLPYIIRISNQSSHRIEAVVSVDGRDAISGQIGDYVNQRGYIVNPFESIAVSGFRRSMNTVAQFRFTRRNDSYAGRMGSTHNLGVIGVAIFPEGKRDFHQIPRRQKSAADDEIGSPVQGSSARFRRAPPDSSSSSNGYGKGSRFNLGTQFGPTQKSEAVSIRFHRLHQSQPEMILSLHYDDYQGLVDRGIILRKKSVQLPNPFPRNSFAPPPP